MNKTMELFCDSCSRLKMYYDMSIKLQGHRLSDPIRIFRFRCKRYWFNWTDPKDKSEKIYFQLLQSISGTWFRFLKAFPYFKCLLVLLGKVYWKKYSNSHTILDFNYQKHDVQGFYYKIQISVSPDKNFISTQTFGWRLNLWNSRKYENSSFLECIV